MQETQSISNGSNGWVSTFIAKHEEYGAGKLPFYEFLRINTCAYQQYYQPFSGAGAALTGTTAAAGTAAAAANAQLAIKGIQAAGQAIGALGAASERNKAVARNAQSAKDAYFVKQTS